VATEDAIFAVIGAGEVLGGDARGNRRERIRLDGIVLILVVDGRRDVVITMWRER
jgi:hypothetical protein